MITIAAVHGIGTPETYNVKSEWRRALRIDGWRVSFNLIAVRWPSTTPFHDIRRLATSRAFVDDAIGSVTVGLAKALPEVDVVVASSLGEPLSCAALRMLDSSVPVVSLGSPRSHPILRQLLKLRGLDLAPRGPVLACTNRDDPIATPKALGARFPTWVDHLRIAIPGAPVGPFGEHAPEVYLRSPHVRSAIAWVAVPRGEPSTPSVPPPQSPA